MGLSIGIVGLPNVGKSTLFTALTDQTGLAANYPFATIDPNVGIVPVPDERLAKLAEIVNPGRIVPATVEFVDIAGLVKGASQGEGLGNQFLANIRETDAICEVVRYFSDPDVIRHESSRDPQSDIETIRTELILADLQTLEHALPRLEKDAKRDKANAPKYEVACRVQEWLNEGHPARSMDMQEGDVEHLYDLHLLTMKPVMYLANVDEADVAKEFEPIEGLDGLAGAAGGAAAGGAGAGGEFDPAKPLPICAQVEAELAELSEEERAEYLQELGLKESGLERLAKAAYKLLGLQSFFTAGEMEVKAWTIPVGCKAPQAAGVIHTDFERGFIKAETCSYEDFVTYGGEHHCREQGKLRQEGKDYVVADGDVMHFKFNVSK